MFLLQVKQKEGTLRRNQNLEMVYIGNKIFCQEVEF